MRFNERLRLNSVTYLVASFLIRWVYNLSVLLYHGFTDVQKAVLHLVLALGSVVLGWIALQLYRKAKPTGSNLGCLYLVLLLVNIIGGLGALFFSMVQFFNEDGNSEETLWLL
jgi:hypothetical protein